MMVRQAQRWRTVAPHSLLCIVVALMLSACGARPGPEVLVPVSMQAPGARLVTVLVATTRQRAAADGNVFTSDRASALNYAAFTISVPPNHEKGKIEWPGGQPNPATTFATVSQTVLDEKSFRSRLAANHKATGKRETGVFVHGYNYNFQEALFRLAQLSADSNASGAPVLFAWPSEAAVAGYVADKEAVTYSRDYLANLLGTLVREPGAGRVTLVGHSMGGWLAMEALRQLRLSGQDATLKRLDVVLAAPDIDIDVFRQQLEVVGPLDPPMTVLVSTDDRALLFSQRLSYERKRLGAVDVQDPRSQEAARKANVRLVDISKLAASDPFNHDRFVTFATIYAQLAGEGGQGASEGGELRQAGAFVFNGVGAAISSPFTLAGRVLGGQ